MSKKWIVFYVLLTIFFIFEVSILYNSWFESHYHGYDGGYFLFFVIFGALGGIFFSVLAIIFKIVEHYENADKR